jgi:hypothetical protein
VQDPWNLPEVRLICNSVEETRERMREIPKIEEDYGGGEAGFPKNLFKNQSRLSNPPPHPNEAS